MKWIDFDKLEELDEEEAQEQEEDMDRLFFEELTGGQKSEKEEEDEDYWSLPVELEIDREEREAQEEAYIHVPGAGNREAADDNDIREAEQESDYVRVPVTEDETPSADVLAREERKEAELVAVEAQAQNLYELSEEEAESITLDEKRAQIGRMLGLGDAVSEQAADGTEPAGEAEPSSDADSEPESEEEFNFDFEEAAQQYVKQLQEEYKKEQEHTSYDPHAYDSTDADTGYEDFKERYGREELFAKNEEPADAEQMEAVPEEESGDFDVQMNEEPEDELQQQAETEPEEVTGYQTEEQLVEETPAEEIEAVEDSSFVEDAVFMEIEKKERLRILDIDETMLVDEDDFEEDEPAGEECVDSGELQNVTEEEAHNAEHSEAEQPMGTEAPETEEPEEVEPSAAEQPVEPERTELEEPEEPEPSAAEQPVQAEIPEIERLYEEEPSAVSEPENTEQSAVEEVQLPHRVVDIRDVQDVNRESRASSGTGVLQKRKVVRKTPNQGNVRKLHAEMAHEAEGQPEYVQKSREQIKVAEETLKPEKKPKLQKLQSAFEDEFEDQFQDELFTRATREQRKMKEQKEKERKKKQDKNRRRKNWEEDDTPDRPFKEFLGLLICIVVVVLAVFVLVNYVGQRTEVSGSSMETTLHDGDNLIVDKISYKLHDPERFDIIVFPYKSASSQDAIYYIKRIIGLPGERVQIENGFIYINGELLDESYGKDNELILNPGRASQEIKLGEDEYFVLGDNRNNSSDSREIGNIKREDIEGKAWLRIYPFDKIGILKHQ